MARKVASGDVCSASASCQVPAGVYITIDADDQRLSVTGFVSTPDGKRSLRGSEVGSLHDPETMVKELATRLLDAGGREILSELRSGGGQ